ncbi:hypothetical protein BCEP27_120018 [Burkholderia cepacia]
MRRMRAVSTACANGDTASFGGACVCGEGGNACRGATASIARPSDTGERHAAMPHALADDVSPLGPHTAAADASSYGVIAVIRPEIFFPATRARLVSP